MMHRYYRLQRHVKLGRDRRERLMKVPTSCQHPSTLISTQQNRYDYSQNYQDRTKQARNVIVAARPYWLQGYPPPTLKATPLIPNNSMIA
jgi:hypothetical protein